MTEKNLNQSKEVIMSYNFSDEQKKSYYTSRMNDSSLTDGQRKYARDMVTSLDNGKQICDSCRRPVERTYAKYGSSIKVCGPCSRPKRKFWW